MNSVGDRLGLYLAYLGIKPSVFDKTVGLSNGMTGKIISNKTSFTVETAQKIISKNKDLSLDWLLMEEGTMLKSDAYQNAYFDAYQSHKDKTKDTQLSMHTKDASDDQFLATNGVFKNSNSFKAEYPINETKVLVVSTDLSHNSVIPQISIKAAAGYPGNYHNPSYIENMPHISLPGRQYQAGTFISLEVKGDSMHPTIYNRDYVIAKLLTDPISEIKDNYIHVIVTKEDIVVKRVLNRLKERSHLYLKSDNGHFRPYKVHSEDILQVWRVVVKMSSHLPNENESLLSRMNDLESQLIELASQLPGQNNNSASSEENH